MFSDRYRALHRAMGLPKALNRTLADVDGFNRHISNAVGFMMRTLGTLFSHRGFV